MSVLKYCHFAIPLGPLNRFDPIFVQCSEVVWAVRNEMARSIEDVLARRTRSLLLDARASIEVAPKVAKLMAHEMSKDDFWIERQVREYTEMAQGYVF